MRLHYDGHGLNDEKGQRVLTFAKGPDGAYLKTEDERAGVAASLCGEVAPYQRPPDSRERAAGDELYNSARRIMEVLPSGLPVDRVKDLALAMEDWACLRTDQTGEDSRC